MSTAVTATELRTNLYRILDEVLDTGVAQEVVLKGQKLLIIPAETRRRRLEGLPRRKVTTCTFDELVDTSWAESWKPGL